MVHSPHQGAHALDGPVTAVDVWQMLHANSQEWETVPKNANFYNIREMLDQADRDALRKLTNFDALHWEHLCFGAGWTGVGAIALSWCKGATFDQVPGAWQFVTPEIDPNPSTLRTASMMCPLLFPESRSLSQLSSELSGDVFKISLSIAALRGTISVDVVRHDLEQAPAQLRPLILYALDVTNEETLSADLAHRWNGQSD